LMGDGATQQVPAIVSEPVVAPLAFSRF
jgi:hypothetical protein